MEVSAHVREIMFGRNAGRKRRDGAGQSLVEFGLLLPVLLLAGRLLRRLPHRLLRRVGVLLCVLGA